ncbi:protein of unknown function [Streptococcus thermophilus]|nr:protein of unknown function [Streptococcus thermophilus]
MLFSLVSKHNKVLNDLVTVKKTRVNFSIVLEEKSFYLISFSV